MYSLSPLSICLFGLEVKVLVRIPHAEPSAFITIYSNKIHGGKKNGFSGMIET